MNNPYNSRHKLLPQSFLFLICLTVVGSIVSRFAFVSAAAMHPDLAIVAAFQVSGKVRNQLGNPLPNTTIAVTDPGTGSTIVSATTDASGNYSLSVEGGTYTIKVTPPAGSGFQSVTALNRVIAGATILDFALVPADTSELSGRLLDALGNPLPRQNIGLALAGTNNYRYVLTDATGKYSIRVSPGNYRLNIEGGNTDASLNIAISSSIYSNSALPLTESILLDIILPFKRISVRIQDPTGTPVPNMSLSTPEYSSSSLTIGAVTATGHSYYPSGSSLKTNASGEATLWLLPATYAIRATPPTGSSLIATNLTGVSITSNTTIPITLSAPITLSGRLLDGLGNGIPNQVVYIAPAGVSIFSFRNTFTSAAGSYSFELPPGTYNLRVRSSSNVANAPRDYSLESRSPLTLTQSTVRDIVLPAKQVKVHVQDPSGNPVRDVTLTTSDVFNSSLTLGNLPAQGDSGYPTYAQPPKTDINGDAILWLYPTPTGRFYNITASPPSGNSLAITTLSNIAITSDANLTLNLTPPSILSGQVLDALGTGLPSQTIEIAPAGWLSYNYSRLTTDATGRYSFNLSPGDYDLRVSGSTDSIFAIRAPGYYTFQNNSLSLSLTQSTLMNITLPVKRVTVRVQDPGGFPVPNVTISTTDPYNYNLSLGTLPAYGYSYYSAGRGLKTDSNGEATLWLFPATYIITATPPAGSPFAPFHVENVSITSDKTVIAVFNINHPPPVTTATVTSPLISPGIYQDPAMVTLAATAAPGFAIANIFYSIDGGATQTYTAPFTVSGARTHTVKYHSVDNSGVVEADKTLSLTLASKQTQATLLSSLNPSAFGQPVTFTATVSASTAGAGTPAGTVTFRDGSIILGTGTLNASGQTAFTTSSLSVGSHSITATYSGNSSFNSSTSLGLIQIVNGADLTIANTATPNPVLVGSLLSYTITVTNNGPATATSVVVTDVLPATTAFVSCAATSGGVCSGAGNNRTVSFASLAAGASATVTLTAAVTAQLIDGDNISNTASVTSAVADPVTQNNEATATVRIRGIAQARLTLNGGKSGFDFDAITVRREPPATPPSDTFTVENFGNAPLVLSFTSIVRGGSDVDGQKITNADDRNLYSLRAINVGGTETPIGIGAASTIGIGQRQSFRLLYNPVMPLVGDRTRGLSASQVLQDVNASTLTLNQNGGDPLRVNLIGRINPTVQMISPVIFRRDGNDIVIEASAYDPNLNTYLMRFQFLDSAGRNVGLAHDVELREAIRASTIVKGQSFVVEQRFPGAAANQNLVNVRVTTYDGEGDSTATSGATTQTVNALATVSAASYSEFGIANEAVVSAFGSGLATTTMGAVSRPLPTALGGTTVKIKDSMGTERLALLFYVSPTQVNYLIPAETKPGLAMITVTSSEGKVAMGTANIAWVAPSLFSANSNGAGVAAAAIQRVKADGTQSYEAVAAFDPAQNKFMPVPINLGTAAEQVYLTLFGTGIRHCSSLASVQASIGGLTLPVAYAGAQGDFVGLDQVNVLLPRSLAGRGEIEVILSVDHQITNTVKINVR